VWERSLGKKLVIIAFIGCLAVALYVFFTHEVKSLRENLTGVTEKEPRVVLEDFEVYRHDGQTLKATLMARMAQLFEPNLLEMDGEIRAVRFAERSEETLGSEAASAYFKASSFGDMMTDTELVRADLTGFVEVGVKEHILTTDYAEYLADTEIIRSDRPVRVEGPGRVFSGEEGFKYQAKDGSLSLPGIVKGEVQPSED